MGLGSVLGLVPELSNKRARVHIQPLKITGEFDDDLGAKGLPFWPDSINDSEGANWEEKTIPGGSLPIYQYVSGTARTLAFTVVLSRDTQEVDPADDTEDVHNIDVGAAVQWLKALKQPLYLEDGLLEPPPLCILVFEGAKLGFGVNDEILTILTQCDTNWINFFNDGTPRLAEVSLSFNEVIQVSDFIAFAGRDAYYEAAAKYLLDPKPGNS